MIRKDQIKKIHTLLNKLGLMDEKQDLVHQASNGRCTSTKKLTVAEADALIWHLQPDVKRQEERKKAMINKLLYYGYEMGYDEPITAEQRHQSASKVNFDNVSAWCASDKCSVQKHINSMTYEELNQALSQFEKVYKKSLNRI